MGTRPLGAAAGGLLAELFGLRAVFGIMAALVLALFVGMRVVTESSMNAADGP